MNEWFTVEKLDADTFAISEYRHWEETHCYLLCGSKKALLIDTGLGVGSLRRAVEALTNLSLEVVTTHVHWDHIGGHHEFDSFAVHEAEREWIEGSFPTPLGKVKENLKKQPCELPAEFKIENYRIFSGKPSRILADGDSIDLGGRMVRALHTPGHSPGHLCFYEEDRRALYTGDLIYAGKLDAFYPTTDPESFRNSVHRMELLPVKRILPGHHSLQLPPCFISRVSEAFDRLRAEGKLIQGGGIFPFQGFQIHL